ncbi:MAG: RNA polymerase subunit sigma-24 [Acidobacteria bacterium]|nr:MAG: RNA polymerase subunit sigma-24 [Acidobacteriota bacterium]
MNVQIIRDKSREIANASRTKICNRRRQPATICFVSQSQDDVYQQATTEFGDALDRLVRAYELDSERRRDLLQDIHLALWRSFEKFQERCSLRTWVYRVAHNVATSQVIRKRYTNSQVLLSIEEIETVPIHANEVRDVDERLDAERLLQLIHRLKPPDRELMLLYLEDLDAVTIGEITGLSSANVRSKIHRIKTVLARRFQAREQG